MGEGDAEREKEREREAKSTKRGEERKRKISRILCRILKVIVYAFENNWCVKLIV